MAQGVPPDDDERLLLSGPLIQSLSVAWPALWVTALMLLGVIGLRRGGPDTPLAVVLLGLPFVGALVWWRWGTPLRRVVATRTGLLVSGLTSVHFIPYAAVASARENRMLGWHPITVMLREPVGGLHGFVFIPRYRHTKVLDEHPIVAELSRRLKPSDTPPSTAL